MSDCKWMIIYPTPARDTIDIALVLDYEQNDWRLASFQRIESEKEAALYAKKLSEKSGIALSRESDVNPLLHIIDLEETNEL